MKARILWVEGKRTDSASFVSSLRKKEYWVEIVPTGSAAVACLVEVDPDLVVVNAASFRSSGKRICNLIREESDRLPIVLIISPEHAISGVTQPMLCSSYRSHHANCSTASLPCCLGTGKISCMLGISASIWSATGCVARGEKPD